MEVVEVITGRQGAEMRLVMSEDLTVLTKGGVAMVEKLIPAMLMCR